MLVAVCVCVCVEWMQGAALCKVIPYLQGVAVGASVNTLVAVAFERSVTYCADASANDDLTCCHYLIDHQIAKVNVYITQATAVARRLTQYWFACT
jgi:hypothetical protein